MKRHNYRAKLIFLLTAGTIGIIFLVIGMYQMVEFMDSTAFCGRLCHQVMYPEYVTHQVSPHSNVTCAQCHVGRGADYLVKSKLSGLPLITATILGNYERPIPTPVKNLRPARDICEQCHQPGRFSGDLVRVHTKYLQDENNTQQVDSRILRVGGGELGIAHDIHWLIAGNVWYLPMDEKRQQIGWVGIENEKGELVTEYIDPDKAAELIHTDTVDLMVQDDISNNKYPMPCYAEGKDEVFVGRLRRDESNAKALNMWIVSDNLRKGAATNAVQIAEYIADFTQKPSFGK